MSGIRFAACFVLGLVLVAPVAGSESENRPRQLNRLRQAAINAKDRHTATEAYTKLFEGASERELEALQNDSDTGIGLYARWNASKLADPELSAASHPERFVGFLEGRTGLLCPATWACTLVAQSPGFAKSWAPAALRTYGPLGLIEIQDTELGLAPGNGLPVMKTIAEGLHQLELGGQRFEVPENVQVRADLLTTRGVSVPLRNNVIDILRREASKFNHSLRVIISGRNTFITVSSLDAKRFPLLCLDTKTGNIRWISEVWASRSMGRDLMGYWHNHVELSVGRQVIGVFGSEPFTCYAEGFDIESGNPVFRFNQGLWEPKATEPAKVSQKDATP